MVKILKLTTLLWLLFILYLSHCTGTTKVLFRVRAALRSLLRLVEKGREGQRRWVGRAQGWDCRLLPHLWMGRFPQRAAEKGL